MRTLTAHTVMEGYTAMTLSNIIYASLKKQGRYNPLFFDLEGHHDIDIDGLDWKDESTDHWLTDFEE